MIPDPISDAIASDEARQRAHGQHILRVVILCMIVVVVLLLVATYRKYQTITAPLPVSSTFRIVDSMIWEAGYQQWLDTVDGSSFSPVKP